MHSLLMLVLVGALDEPAELLQHAARQAEFLRQAAVRHSVQTLGGTAIGKNEGEWGGEVAFHEPDGISYQVIDDNSIGIFEMPYGTIAITGLAHMGTNNGSVHLLARPQGSRVVATRSLQLPGWPCVAAQDGNRIRLRIFLGYSTATDRAEHRCYSLYSATQLIVDQCPAFEPHQCFR